MSTPHYDDIYEMEKSCKTLSGLNQLMRDRHKAGYERGERLNEWLILGRLWMDTCGNTAIIYDTKLPVTDSPVMHSKNIVRDWCSGMPFPMPDVHNFCQHCKKGWDIADWFDCEDRCIYPQPELSGDDSVNGMPIMGRTMAELRRMLNEQGDGKSYTVSCDVFNPGCIDLSPHQKSPDMKVNEFGRVVRKPHHFIDELDTLIVDGREYFHIKCLKKHNAKEETKYFADIFKEAGYEDFDLQSINNQYWKKESVAPWFNVETEIGKFTIGWRKRVVSIEWPHRFSALALFEDEKVTKWPTGIHAWGKDKCVEYLQKIREFALDKGIV